MKATKRITKNTIINLLVIGESLNDYTDIQIEKIHMMLRESTFNTTGKKELIESVSQEVRDRRINRILSSNES